MARFTKERTVRRLRESLAKPENSNIRDELGGAVELLECGELDRALERQYPDYPALEKTLREIWKEKTTRVSHGHRWAWKMAPGHRGMVRTCLTCGGVERFER